MERQNQRKKSEIYDNKISKDIVKANGFNIKKKRLRKGWTQTKLASELSLYLTEGKSKMHFTFQQIQKYEKADNKINSVILLAFSHIFNCDLRDFFEIGEFDFPQEKTIDATQQAVGT